MSELTPAQQQQKKRVFTLFAVIMLVAALLVLGWWWFVGRSVESTDDAFIDGHLAQVSAQVDGRISRIVVQDNQRVKRGDLLLELDPRDRQIALDKALAARAITEARLAQTRAELTALEANIGQAEANLQLAEVESQRDQKEYQRYRNSGSAVSHSDLDAKAASAKTSAATLQAQRKTLSYNQAQLQKAQATLQEYQATLQQDDSEIASARLLLSYTRVTAPSDGFVTKRTAEAGNTISSGTTLMYVIDDHVWVTANFKETQLAHMRPGQRVEVSIDAWPQQRYQAKVDSIQRGTGAVFSLLPAENATGNYVKIVQRVPVKIVFTDDAVSRLPLAPGMSVIPYVSIQP
ncbi:HlyD family secretion protein [Erwinia sp. V71]|uniref:HlyD family secretion protein n=1 Tax=Erwinia sp. V71 TaxID=3369424 RepID=UPI003F61EDE2